MVFFQLTKRAMIYGYFLFIGYQLLRSLPTNKEFTESVTKFETLYDKQFTQLYQTLPQLVQYKFTKYPVVLMGCSALSVLFGGVFALFTLASHVLLTYLTNKNLVNLVLSVNPKMDFLNFAQNLELDVILLLAVYLGVFTQLANSIFGGKRCCNADHSNTRESTTTGTEANRNTSSGSRKKKHL
jgi:hypothetical protein